jgi:hypothetical protein
MNTTCKGDAATRSDRTARHNADLPTPDHYHLKSNAR